MLSISAPATSAGLPPQDDITQNGAATRSTQAAALHAHRPGELIGRILETLTRHASGEQPLSRSEVMRLLLSLAAIAGIAKQPDEGLRVFTQRIAHALEAMLPEVVAAGSARSPAPSTDAAVRSGRMRPEAGTQATLPQTGADGRTVRVSSLTSGLRATQPSMVPEVAQARILPPQGPALTPVMLQALVTARVSEGTILQSAAISETKRRDEGAGTGVVNARQEEKLRSEAGSLRPHVPRQIPVPANLFARAAAGPALDVALALSKGADHDAPERIAPLAGNRERSMPRSDGTREAVLPAESRLRIPAMPAADSASLRTAEQGPVAPSALADVSQAMDAALSDGSEETSPERPLSVRDDTRDDHVAGNPAAADRAEIDTDGTYRITNVTEELLAEAGLAEPVGSEGEAAAGPAGRTAAESDRAPLPAASGETATDGAVAGSGSQESAPLSAQDIVLLDEAERAASPEAPAAKEGETGSPAASGTQERSSVQQESVVAQRGQTPPSATLPMVFPPAFVTIQTIAGDTPRSPAHRGDVDPVDENGTGNGDADDGRHDGRSDRRESQPETAEMTLEEASETNAEDGSPDAYRLYRLLAGQQP